MKTKLTIEDVKSKIVSETFTTLPSGKTIICELILKNGFSVRGESSVVDISNFIQDIGEQIARDNAIDKIWQIEGYLLQQKLFEKDGGE